MRPKYKAKPKRRGRKLTVHGITIEDLGVVVTYICFLCDAEVHSAFGMIVHLKAHESEGYAISERKYTMLRRDCIAHGRADGTL